MENTETRELGFSLKFDDNSVEFVCKQIERIRDAVKVHGVICLKGLDFNEEQLIQLGRAFADELVVLPIELSFNNKDPKYPEIARVGNVLMDGTLKDSSKEAAVWHQGGGFQEPEAQYIFNFLHTREIPTKGGDTHFVDLLKAKDILEAKYPEIYEQLKKHQVKIDTSIIPNFIPQIREGIEITKANHDVIHTHPFNKKEFIYVGNPSHVMVADDAPLSREDLVNLAVEAGIYAHKWEEGDIVIWDNIQVMHRAAGAFEGRRQLWRVQSRMWFNK